VSEHPDSTLVDPACPHPNVAGIPLWLLPNPLDQQDNALVVELWRRARASTHLGDYAAFTLGVVPAAHHRLICEAIDGLLNDDYDDLLINTPPGAAKSTYVSHALAAYFLGRFPKENVILATHTAELAERWSRRVRDTVASPEHQRVFPGSALSRDSTAVGRWATVAGGEFLAAGVGGAILGFRALLAVIDDPVKDLEQAQALSQLQKIHDWYETSLLTRLKPGGKVAQVCQRLSPNDLAGYMIQRHRENPTRRLRLLVLKMEATPALPGELPDPLNRQPGERLWPDYFTQEMVEDARRDDFKWRTLYQQEPPSESGSWVSPEDIQIVDTAPSSDAMTHYLLSDLALSVNSGDYSVHLAVGIDENRSVYVVDAWRDRCDPNRTADRHLDLIDAYKPVESLIDDDNAAKVYVQLLASKARERGVPVPWKMLPMRGQDKETRAAPLRGQFKRRKVFLKRAPWNGWLVRELLSFPNAMGEGVDDGVDALGLIGRRLASLAASSPAPLPVAPVDPRGSFYSATLDQLWEHHSLSNNTRRRF
jgi:predicted phage terminase large subunit-like protein